MVIGRAVAPQKRPTVFLFALGESAPAGLEETPCYIYREGGERHRKVLAAIPESPISDEVSDAMFEAIAAYVEEHELSNELYTDEEVLERDDTDEDPMGFHPGLGLDAAREALAEGGFLVVVHQPGPGNPRFGSAGDALDALEHHLRHSSATLAREVTPETFSHHHLELARFVLTSCARGPLGAEVLEGVKARRAHWPSEAVSVLDTLVEQELANPEGVHEVGVLASEPAKGDRGGPAPSKAKGDKGAAPSKAKGAKAKRK